jgi:hypothetical protein
MEPESLSEFLRPEPALFIHQTDEHLEIYTGKYWYPIPLKDLRLATKVMAWLKHLTEKNWMTTQKVNQFISAVCDINQWDAYL